MVIKQINHRLLRKLQATLTNRRQGSASVSGTKTWKKTTITKTVSAGPCWVNLLADGVIPKASKEFHADNWSYSFDIYQNLLLLTVVYTITEDAVAEYSTQVEGYNLTNSHTRSDQPDGYQKQWQDQGDQDGLRPAKSSSALC